MTLSPRGLSDEDRTAGATRAIEYSIAFTTGTATCWDGTANSNDSKDAGKGTLRQYVEANLYRPDDK